MSSARVSVEADANENLEGNILRLKLIQVFPNGTKEVLDSIIESNDKLIKLSKDQGPLSANDLNVLNIAVQVAPLDKIRHIITKYKGAPALDINGIEHQTGNTPLHIAAMYGRSDVVMYLLSFDDTINDTIENNQGKQPVEVARTPELVEAMQVVRAKYVEKVATQMKNYFSQSNIPALEELLSNPRAAALLDINGQDPDTGSTVLHDFVRAGNIPMIDFILSHGGDPLQRNSKGILPIDFTKNETIRKMLKSSTKAQQVIVQSAGISPIAMKNRSQLMSKQVADSKFTPGVSDNASAQPSFLGPPPVMKGFLKKWTNFTGGYKLRWFVLENNVLSYYKRQNDTESACRGSINMRQARLHVDSSEKLGFEVLSNASVKFHLKANHPVETSRWVWALTNAIQYAKEQEKIKNLKSNHRRFPSGGSNNLKNVDSNVGCTDAGISPTFSSSKRHSAIDSTHAVPTSFSSGHADQSAGSPTSSLHPPSLASDDDIITNNVAKLVQMNNSEIERRGNFDRDDEGEEEDEDDEHDDYINREEPPFIAETKVAESSIGAGLKSIEMVLSSLSTNLASNSLSPEELKKSITSLEQAVSMISNFISQLAFHVSSREKYYQAKLDRANHSQDLWAQAIQDLELEKGKIQHQLHEAIQKKRQANKVLREVTGTSGLKSSRSGISSPALGTPGVVAQAPIEADVPTEGKEVEGLASALVSAVGQAIPKETFQSVDIESESESELEDEFFDALGAGDDDEFVEQPQPPNVFSSFKNQPESSNSANAAKNLSNNSIDANVPVSSAVPSTTAHGQGVAPVPSDTQHTHPQQEFASAVPQDTTVSKATEAVPPSAAENGVPKGLTESQLQKYRTIADNNSFAGYEDGPRKRLDLDDDNRPKISLWGVLKNLVGKDMTRMTLPVSFNECTGLLQRSAEDMEYTDLLDKAASITDDPGERMAYVAAFAASSYSSTIGRVAKPFNPLLGETFEYARPDMGYRMFSEQVSHHPPIGAMMAESPRWDFYGASNVKSKFTGRSFDINPLGLWYIKLRPNEGTGIEEESYSFRKVTSTVVGIITGNPVVDQYGDMEIINYTLGYKCLLKFKARGWLSDSAYEVRGTVYNKEGVPQWIVGGRWNDKIFGKKVRSDEANDITKGKTGDLGEKTDRVLLWRVHESVKSPFNLTSFAITLNALPKRLAAWLPESDTRFRPDQRAMEEGRYDAASDEKHRVEEKQRAQRREREAKNEVYSPRWFEKKVHPLSGQEYWSYKGDYWEERKDHAWKGIPDLY